VIGISLGIGVSTGSGGPASSDPPGTGDLRAYLAGDIPPGLFPDDSAEAYYQDGPDPTPFVKG
jgi:hypothetical protein